MTIKLKDLAKIVRDYHGSFPDWTILGKDTIARSNGPVMQGILFDRATADVYKPTGFLRIMSAPQPKAALDLPQRLKHPNGAPDRSISFHRHQYERNNIVASLQSQLRPDITRPLNPMEVLTYYEQEAVPTPVQAYVLASLRAYLGDANEAHRWIVRFRELMMARDLPLTDVDRAREAFIRSLEDWLNMNQAQKQLEFIITAERGKLGLP